MTMALANMQIVISRLLRSLRIIKGPTRWLNGEPHRQRENLLDRPDGHKRVCTATHFMRVHVRPARSIFSNALKFRRSAIAALVRSPCRYCPFRAPGGPPLLAYPLPDRAASSEDFEAQQRLVTSVRFDVVTRRAEETRFEFRHSSGSPLVQELAHEAERVHLVIMLARRKGEQLCFQVR
jgi:hypothetical protein